MVTLFESTTQNISLHINNVFNEGELNYNSTVKEHLTVQIEGTRKVQRKIAYYNLDVIISVGYRVKSQRGTQFRIWANKVLKDYLLKGYAIHQRFETIEKKLSEHDQKFDLILKTALPPNEGIFYDGQIFDAPRYRANPSRGYQVLTLLAKRHNNVLATIYTPSISKQLQLDLERYKAQYPHIEVKTFSKSHDRFLIIDQTTVYHIGASLKDLGKTCMVSLSNHAFSKMELPASEILSKLQSGQPTS